MTSNNTIDAARVELLLSELRLPAIKLMWAALAARAATEGWPAARFRAAWMFRYGIYEAPWHSRRSPAKPGIREHTQPPGTERSASG